jgi:hypothetical protein
VGVPLVAADLVGRAAGEPADVEGVKADLGVRDRLADRALVLAAHVDRDGADRVLAVAELGEELTEGGAVAARAAPHDRARRVVGDRGQVAMVAPPADLVDADADQFLEPALVEVVSHDALDDLADRAPTDAQQPRDRRLGHLLRQPRDDVFEVARVRRSGPRPRHRLQAHAAIAATQPAQLALDDAAVRAQVQVPPALQSPVVDLKTPALTALRADAPAPAQPHPHEHPFAGEADIDDGCPGQAEQPLECGGDAHVALL